MTMVTFAMSEALREKVVFPDFAPDRWLIARVKRSGGGRREFFAAAAEFDRIAAEIASDMGVHRREVANWLSWNLPWGDCGE